ncbi:MAG: DUF3048 domain-containing protein [Patescibacteria group bacterium]|nr:DUF3048 domain-containing protein [Patescibacteria group bacterium]MDD5172871.1 DUF3048 domain-containing protein [Patescibacteria group bacterium]
MNLKSVKIGLFLGIIFIIIWAIIFLNPEEKEKIEIMPEEENIEVKEEINEIKDYSLEGNRANKLPIAVVIDNFNESWPIIGINQAAVIYETPVEADITRLLAIFNQDYLPNKIGPVRSARPYLAEWAEEYGSLLIHAGGSQDFLDKMERNEYQVYNLDEISNDGIYFWREKTRDKPHNLYISGSLIKDAIENKKINNQLRLNFFPRQFVENFSLTETIPGLIIKINYREPVLWQYDKESKSYLRFQDNREFFDENEEQVKTSNLIIQKTEIRILDEVGRRFIKTVGEGEALIFQNGYLIKGIWRKAGAGQQTIFYNLQNQEIKFLPGNIWVEIISNNHQIVY